MSIPAPVLSTATEYLRLGDNDDLQVFEVGFQEAIAQSADKPGFIDEAGQRLHDLATSASPDDSDRLQVLLDVLERQRSLLS